MFYVGKNNMRFTPKYLPFETLQTAPADGAKSKNIQI